MYQMTTEQQQRSTLLIELRKMVGTTNSACLPLANGTWLHFTDWYGKFDLPMLEHEGFVHPNFDLKYEPRGDWHDDFPPDAYRITSKAFWILEHPTPWIYYGATTDEEWETANPSYFVQMRQYRHFHGL